MSAGYILILVGFYTDIRDDQIFCILCWSAADASRKLLLRCPHCPTFPSKWSSTRYNLELLISDELNLPNGWDFIDIGWMIGTLLIWEGCPMRKGLYMVMWPRCFLPRARGLNLWRMESPRADTSAVYWTTTIRGFSPHSVKINVYKTNPRLQKGVSDHSGVCSYYL